MDIKTRFGICKDVKIEPYIEEHNTFILGFIRGNFNTKYDVLGFDAPVEGDPEWRYWVTSGSPEGNDETNDAQISEEDKLKIQKLYSEYLLAKKN